MEWDQGILRATDGRLDLPTLAGVVLLAAGTLEVLVRRRLPAPPWFNLAYWGLQYLRGGLRQQLGAPAGSGRAEDMAGAEGSPH